MTQFEYLYHEHLLSSVLADATCLEGVQVHASQPIQRGGHHMPWPRELSGEEDFDETSTWVFDEGVWLITSNTIRCVVDRHVDRDGMLQRHRKRALALAHRI